MGGEIGFGVRWHDKTTTTIREVYMRRWTNDLFWRMMKPSFLDKGDELQELINEAKPENEWPDSVLCNEIEPSEYGIVLVDFPSRSALCANHYSEFGRMIFSPHHSSHSEEIELVKELLKRGMVRAIKPFGHRNWDKPDLDLKEFEQMLIDGKLPDDSVTVHLAYEVFTIEVKHEHPTRDEVAAWCKEKGWVTPISTSSGWNREEEE